MTDIGQTRSLIGDDGDDVLTLKWCDSEEGFEMECRISPVALGATEAIHLLGMFGDLYREMVGQEPSHFFAKDSESDD